MAGFESPLLFSIFPFVQGRQPVRNKKCMMSLRLRTRICLFGLNKNHYNKIIEALRLSASMDKILNPRQQNGDDAGCGQASKCVSQHSLLHAEWESTDLIETRQRIAVAMEELGYRPHPLARGLASKHSRILPSFSLPSNVA